MGRGCDGKERVAMRRLKRDKPAAGLPAAVGTGPDSATVAACGVGHDAARQPLVFLGRRTLSKLYLMLHLGRLMSLSGPVRLDTVNPQVSAETCYEHNGIDIHEHPDEESLRRSLSLEPETEGRRMLDAAGAVSLPPHGRLVLVTDPDRNSVEGAMSALSGCGGSFCRVHRVYVDLCAETRVGVRVLEGMLLRSLPEQATPGQWYALEMDERDRGAMLNNQHEDTLRLNRLTPSYRALLAALARTCFGMTAIETARALRDADKRKYRPRPSLAGTGR